MRHVFALCCAWVTAAHADTPLAYKHVNPPLAADPAPAIRILQPTPDQVNTTHEVHMPGGSSYAKLACLVEDKDRVIRLAVDHWPIKPGGAGILVVVDGQYATVVHDVSKPIRIDDLEPLDSSKSDAIGVSPLTSCRWHWIAAVPTVASGQMLDVAPVVTWYGNQSQYPQYMPLGTTEHEKKQPLVVLNLPLMGKLIPGGEDRMSQPPGIVSASPGKLMVDYTIAQRPECRAKIMFSEHQGEGDHEMSRHGLEIVDHGDDQDQLQYIAECPNGESSGGGWEGIYVFGKAQSPRKAMKWPSMTSEQADKEAAAKRVAHRLPGKHPYDGTFYGQGGGGMGSLQCPSPLTVSGAAGSFTLMLGDALSYGTLKFTVDENGYIDKTFKLGAPKRVKGKPGDDELDREAGAIAGVVMSGEFLSERIKDSDGSTAPPSTRLELKIEAFDSDGSKTGRECNAQMRLKDHFAKSYYCSNNAATCGTPHHAACCQ